MDRVAGNISSGDPPGMHRVRRRQFFLARARNTHASDDKTPSWKGGKGEERERRGGEDPGFYGSDRQNLRPEIVAQRPWKDDAVKIQPNLSSTRGECFIAAPGINKDSLFLPPREPVV